MKVENAKLYQPIKIGREMTTYLSTEKGMSLEYSNGILMVEHEALKDLSIAVTSANIMEMTVKKPTKKQAQLL